MIREMNSLEDVDVMSNDERAQYIERVKKLIEEREDGFSNGNTISFNELLDYVDELTKGGVNTDKFRKKI